MNINLEITPAEWQVMRVVWSLRQTTSSQIIEILQKKVDWKPATIKTLLRRLVDKKALSATRQGRGFIYEPSFLNNKRWIKQRTTYLIIFVNDMSEAHLNM